MSLELDDDKKIQVALETPDELVETLFWVLEDSIYKGKIDLAKGVLESFLYMAKYKPSVLKDNLQDVFMDRLKQISHELHGNKSTKKITSIDIKYPTISIKIPFKQESDLRDYLANNSNILSDAFQDKVRIYGVEVETDFGYKCDIVSESKKNLYPIELKIRQSSDRATSQIEKYCYYFYRKLRYGQFRKVQGVVISNGSDAWSINEIRRNNHWIFNILPDRENKIKLGKL